MRGKDEEKANARKWLHRYIELKEDSMRELDKAQALRNEAYSLSSSKLSQTPKMKNAVNTVEESVVKFISASERSADRLVESENAKSEIMDVINSIDNVNYRRALKYRYIDGLWEYEIARKMHYSEGYIRNLLWKAVEHVTKSDTYLRYTGIVKNVTN